ncbi:MAG TPA: hypothetical protein VGB73_20535 [Pyrinomonadaceae bacterium]
MKKPAPIVVFSILAMLNGGVTFALGVMTLLGSRILFKPSGYGPNRIAISQLFGPFADQTGWIVLALGIVFVLVGYGLFTLREWARLTVFWVFALVAGATLVAVVWGVYHGEVGVVLSGLLKGAIDAALCLYLMSRGVRNAFSH